MFKIDFESHSKYNIREPLFQYAALTIYMSSHVYDEFFLGRIALDKREKRRYNYIDKQMFFGIFKEVTETKTSCNLFAAAVCDTRSEPMDRQNGKAFRMLTMLGRLSALGDEENAELIRRKLFSMGYFL